MSWGSCGPNDGQFNGPYRLTVSNDVIYMTDKTNYRVQKFDTNGTFHADNIPPGKYVLSLNVTDPEEEYYNRRTIGSVNKEIVVPDEKGAKLNAPFDIGELELPIRAIEPGLQVIHERLHFWTLQVHPRSYQHFVRDRDTLPGN